MNLLGSCKCRSFCIHKNETPQVIDKLSFINFTVAGKTSLDYSIDFKLNQQIGRDDSYKPFQRRSIYLSGIIH